MLVIMKRIVKALAIGIIEDVSAETTLNQKWHGEVKKTAFNQ
jgi:hypothetical protein